MTFSEGPGIFHVPWLSQGGASRVCSGRGGEEYKANKNAEKTAPFKSYPQSFFEGPVIYNVPWLSQGGASRGWRGLGWRGIQSA